MRTPLVRLRQLSLWSSLAFISASGAVAQAAQPVYTPPYVALPNVLYVVPYAVATQPMEAAEVTYPVAETVVTIGNVRSCRVQVEWVDWDGSIAGYSGAPVPPPAVPPSGALEYVAQALIVVPLPPFVLNVFSNLQEPFEGHAKIRSNCQASTKLRIDAEVVIIPSANAKPQYKPIPVIRPAGNLGN